jgi:Mlc titration factor MtfA (ptsG expression regulator)
MFRSRAGRRAELRAKPLEAERVATIARMFPYFSRLSEADQRELVGHVQVFLAEKSFEGCGGLELTDEIKLTIAAQACLLLLHRDTDYYPALDVILVYPHAYVAGHTAHDGAVVVDRDDVRLGESHQRGIVVLSWDAVRGGAADPNDGQNVVFHEFAHQLDQEDGAADGAPVLAAPALYGPWAKILGAELQALKEDVDNDEATVIDKYGAKNPAEFFAVITEAFFEKPRALATRHPELYDELVQFYSQDPLERIGETRPAKDPRVQRREATERSHDDEHVITLCDMSSDPRAPALVFVGDDLRESVRALGCTSCGYLGTLHETGKQEAHRWGFVAEVFRCPDESVVGALSSVGGYGDGLAFWTLLENGTAIETETTARRPFWFRLRNAVGHHPREHFFIASLGAAPREIYATHKRRVDEIARRERTTALMREPFSMYAAVRQRSTDMLLIARSQYTRLITLVFRILFIVAAVAIVVIVACVAPAHAIGMHLVLLIIATLIASIILAQLGAASVARVIHWRQLRSPPVPPSLLFQRAARVDEEAATRLVAILRDRERDK